MRWLIAALVMGCGANTASGKPDAGADAQTDAEADAAIESGCAAPLTTCGAQCVDLRTDIANCGTCGHVCGFCADSKCGPVNLGAPPAAVSAIAADADTIYMLTYASSGGLYSCPFAGCGGSPKLLTPVANHPYSQGTLIAGGGSVFWIDGVIFSCAASGCTAASTFAPAPSSNIATDGTSVYWITSDALVSCPVTGCTTPTTLTTNVSAYTTVALAKGTVVLGNDSSIAICATKGCTSPTSIAAPTSARWLGAGGHYVASTSQSSSASISVIDLSNVAAGPKSIVASEDMPSYFSSDETTLFWADFDIPQQSVLKKCAWTGCASPTTIASTLDSAPTGAAWTLGASAIAWVAGGSLWADAK